MAEDEDYGYGSVKDVIKKTSGGGKYLKLDEDVQVQVRIASKPVYTIRHWSDRDRKFYDHSENNCQWCGEGVENPLKKDAQWYWIVIDRSDESVKIMQASNIVALRLDEISRVINTKTGKRSWGDPRTFDVTILKYRKTNGFTDYKVEPLPDSRGELTAEEKKAVEDAGFDLNQEVKGSQQSQHLGNYSPKDENPFETAAAQVDDLDLDEIDKAIAADEPTF